MKRIHLFEFGDQRWLPEAIRTGFLALLKAQAETLYLPIVPKLHEFLFITDTHTVIDLCSGTGGPWEKLLPALQSRGLSINLRLTDKYPLSDKSPPPTRIDFHPEGVDATHIPNELKGCRTLFTAFHHFRPADAIQILESAIESQQPIGIFEFTERRWSNILGMLFSPLLVWIQIPFLRPLRWQWWVFTYLIPLIPLVYFWDGVISHLRTYSQEELERMVNALQTEGYMWETGEVDSPAGARIQYLLGRKR